MRINAKWAIVAAIAGPAVGCSQSDGNLYATEAYLEILLKAPDAGVDTFTQDYPSAMTVAGVRHVKDLEASGEYEKSRAALMSMIRQAASSHTDATAYLTAVQVAEGHCEAGQGEGHWEGSQMVSLHDFCDAAANLAALTQERADHPAEF
jgi:hypothetical protein